MRKFLFLLPLLLFVSGHELLYAQEIYVGEVLYSDMKNGTFLPLFKALKDGNVQVIKHYISGNMYRQNRVLLEENKDYPRFLRKFYRGANFSVERIITADGDIIADVVIEFPQGSKSLTKLRLSKANDQQWKVVNEIKPELSSKKRLGSVSDVR
jgi:hypothetical protein